MISRDGPVNRFETLRWARAQAKDPRITDLAAWLLIVLASYCDEQASCFPSLAELQDATRRKRRQVIAAMRLLEDLQLVWTRQGGRGRSATRELLFDPAKDSLREPAMRASSAGQAALLDGERQRPSSAAESTPAVRPRPHPEVPEEEPGTSAPTSTTRKSHRKQCGPGRTASDTSSEDKKNGNPRGLRPIGDALAGLHEQFPFRAHGHLEPLSGAGEVSDMPEPQTKAADARRAAS